MAMAKKSARSAKTSKAARTGARKPARPTARASATKGAKSEVVYSDVRRDAIAWRLSRLR